MKTLYFDCFSGVSGDMILGALIDLGVDANYLKNELSKLNLDGWKLNAKKVLKNGISATQVEVETKHEHVHRNLEDITKIINSSSLPENVKKKSINIFTIVAEAEAKVHGVETKEIHFHEVGAIDSIIDIAGAVICIEYLKPEKIFCSAINTGSGFVECAHGTLPVPAPATAEILKGMNFFSQFDGELATPTGAAILKYFAEQNSFENITAEKIGYGAGKKDFRHPNVLRVFLGNETDKTNTDKVNIIETKNQ